MSLGTRLVLGEMFFASLITRTVKVSEIHEWTLHRQEQNRMCKASKERECTKQERVWNFWGTKQNCTSQLQYIYCCAECLTRNFISKSVSMQQSPKLNYYYKQTTKSTLVWTMQCAKYSHSSVLGGCPFTQSNAVPPYLVHVTSSTTFTADDQVLGC